MDIGNANPQASAAFFSAYQAHVGDGRIVSFIFIETATEKWNVVAEMVANHTANETKPVRWTAVLKEGDLGNPHIYVMVAARVSTQDELDALVEWITTDVPDVIGEPTVTNVTDAYSNQVHMDPFNGWP